MRFSKRMERLKEGVFLKLDEEKEKYIQEGHTVYDFTIGSPNIAPSKEVQEALIQAAMDPKSYMYALHDSKELKATVKDWYQKRYHVELDEQREILALQGSQEGLAHIALAVCDEGDVVLIPAPSYPIFANGPRIAGAEVYEMPMLEEYDYQIQLQDIPEDIARRAKMMIVSYPNNPTGAIATDAFFEELVAFAKHYDILVLHDMAYSELVFDGGKAKSFLAYPGAKEVGIEFNSFSKNYGMAGARIGLCVGNKEAVCCLRKLKSNIDYGMFLPIQKAAVAALTQDQSILEETRNTYQRRRNRMIEGFKEAGWTIQAPKGTMFIWAKIPKGYDSEGFAIALLKKTGILVTPGNAFGRYGEGYVRIALVQSDEVIEAAIASLKKSAMFV